MFVGVCVFVGVGDGVAKMVTKDNLISDGILFIKAYSVYLTILLKFLDDSIVCVLAVVVPDGITNSLDKKSPEVSL